MKFRILIWVSIITFIFLIIFPVLLWYLMDPVPLNISVIDKTVPKEDYREHLGLFWLLENNKIVNSDGNLYKIEEDYLGFHPSEFEGDQVLTLPENLDLIYVVDSYGVYTEDFENEYVEERSKLIYGGLSIFDWNKIMDKKNQNTTLIVEFNSLASPTNYTIRKVMEKNLSITWTGWYARYFSDLQEREVPDWLISNYEIQYQKKWDFIGAGITYVNQNEQIVVLSEKDFIDKVRFELTADGIKHYSSAENSYYNYWFDVIIPYDDVIVEAKLKIDLSESGKEKLRKYNIPFQYPAVMHHPGNRTYYFAGDFADIKDNYWARWVLFEKLEKLIAFFGNRAEFFWKSYDPMMTQILDEIEINKYGNLIGNDKLFE